MTGLDDLRIQVDTLLKRFDAVLRERQSLRKELATLRKAHESLRLQLRQSEDRLLALQISKAIPEELRVESRQKLDAVIGEIDKILTTIND